MGDGAFTEKMTWQLAEGSEGSPCTSAAGEQRFSLGTGKERKGQTQVWEKPWMKDEAKRLRAQRVNEMGLPGACSSWAPGSVWGRPLNP